VKQSGLKSLSDKELLAQIEKIRRREHLSTVEILLHLNEVERRKLDLQLGYNSLYDYCVNHLRYSSSGAGRRVAVARCVARHPEVLDLLRSQKLNVTGVALVASALNESNKKKLLVNIQGRSQTAIDAIAARYRRPIALRDRVRPVRVVVPDPKPGVHSGQASAQPSATAAGSAAAHRAEAPVACENNHYSHNGSGLSLSGCMARGNENGNRTQIRSEQKLFVQFLANKAFMKKYEEARALLSQRLSDTSFENVFETLIDEFLDHHCPARRKARRDSKKTNRPTRQISHPVHKKPQPAAGSPDAKQKRRSRHIPAAVRDKVYSRDKGRCTYVGKAGKRCGSTQALQIDHIKPFTRGGANTASNLRLLCARHNRLAAREVFGEEFIKRFQPRE
jgi:5-methylcytosine-specific restriction endonuclease McrA